VTTTPGEPSGQPLAGQVALVTGGSSGIGQRIAADLAARGAIVLAAARRFSEPTSSSGGSIHEVPLDVTDEAACTRTIEECVARFGRLDMLVNNAGIGESAKFTDVDTGLWRRHMAVNVEGAFWLVREALPRMLDAHHGRVVNIASTAARAGFAYVAPYVASKHALLGLTRALAAEYPASGVTFNCIAPFWVDTPLVKRSVENIAAQTGRSPEAALKGLLSPQGRLITAGEVSAMCLFLVSAGAGAITGQCFGVDGGRLQA
jgi:NAD(P)-dependent dehydrogenase (short-subunit alcohol dehydrogenase family)